MLTSLTVGFDTLRTNPLRTILSTLGIVIGVAALVSVLSVGDGMERFAREQIGRTTDLQSVSITGRTTRIVDGTPLPVDRPLRLTEIDATSLAQQLGDSAAVNMSAGGVALVTTQRDTTPHAAQVQGFLAPTAWFSDTLLIAGRYFNTAEAASGAPVVTINYRLASDFARGRDVKDVIGDTLLFQGQPRVVIGVIKASESDRTRTGVMPSRAVEGAVARTAVERTAQIVVTAPTIEEVKPVRASIERWAAERFGANWKERVNVMSNETRLEQAQKGLFLFKVFMGALMSISLVVGGIGIMNVLLSSVIERTREIGIRKAAGAAQRDILWQFLSESVVITGVGSVLGLLLGVTAAFSITAIMRKLANTPVQAWLSPSTVLVAIGASVIVGLAFGLYPAMRAARLSPIDAIHHE